MPPEDAEAWVLPSAAKMIKADKKPLCSFAELVKTCLSLRPTGLADGLALKELRYGRRTSDSPRRLSSRWVPRSGASRTPDSAVFIKCDCNGLYDRM
jgi:hypothetical protein